MTKHTRPKPSWPAGSRPAPLVVEPATPEQLERTRRKVQCIRTAAAELGVPPVAVAGFLAITSDLLCCQADPELVRDSDGSTGAGAVSS